MPSNTPHYADNPSAFPLEGGCPCGQIRYQLHQAPLVVNCCHCTSCQRETGSAFAVNIIIESTSVTDLAPAARGPTAPAHPGEPDTFPATGPALLPPPPPPPTATSASDANVVEPTAVLLPSESGDGQTVVHCPTCFTGVWSDYGNDSMLRWVRGGTLDRPWLVEPDVHIFMRSKRDFITVADGKPQFEKSYKSKEVWRPESLARYAKVRAQQ